MVTHVDAPQFTESLRADLESILHAKSARDVVVIDLVGKSDIADYMIIASGTSDTHVAALARYVDKLLHDRGVDPVASEGMPQNEWVLVDNPYIIVHLFKPEAREHYQLEKMWEADFSGLDPIPQHTKTLELVH